MRKLKSAQFWLNLNAIKKINLKRKIDALILANEKINKNVWKEIKITFYFQLSA